MDDISLSKVEISTDVKNSISTLAKVDWDELTVELKQFIGWHKNFLGLENQCPCPCPNFGESDDSEEDSDNENASKGHWKKCAFA